MRVIWGVNMHNFDADLDIGDALALKRAEMWLEVGRPILALQEMEDLSEYSWGHPWAVRLLDATCAASSQWMIAQASTTAS